MRIYIAGPMTGYPFHNFQAFFEAEAALFRLGQYQVVNPARSEGGSDFLTAWENHENANLTWEQHLRRDLRDMLTCDAVVTLPNWAYSRGARLEVQTARAVGIQDYSLSEVLDGAFNHIVP